MIIGRLAGLLEVKMITHCVLRGASYVLRVARCAVRVSGFSILDVARPTRLSGSRPACHARHERAGGGQGFRIAKRGWAKFGLQARGYRIRTAGCRQKDIWNYVGLMIGRSFGVLLSYRYLLNITTFSKQTLSQIKMLRILKS